MSIAFMFAGQGSQYVGMCQELYNTYDVVKQRFQQASSVLGYDVATIMFEQEQQLNNTLYTQPLMFVMYVSILDVLQLHHVASTHTCGLSLGEYGALYDAGVITFEQGLDLLQHRGRFMAEASVKTSGLMSAILGMDADTLESIIVTTSGYVTIANYNTYGQLVISGEADAVTTVNEVALQQGAKRAITLNTSGPFHSKLMQEAQDLFAEYITPQHFGQPQKSLYVNVTGNILKDDVKDVMANQITSSVLFYQMIERLLEDGVTTFVEIGPKKTLTSFVKKIDRSVTLLQVEDDASLQSTLRKLEENHGI